MIKTVNKMFITVDKILKNKVAKLIPGIVYKILTKLKIFKRKSLFKISSSYQQLLTM